MGRPSTEGAHRADHQGPAGPRAAARRRGDGPARRVHRRRHAAGHRVDQRHRHLERPGHDQRHLVTHRDDDRRPPRSYRAARTASLSAQSGHAKGIVTREGTRLGIDVEGLANGSNQTVFITTPDGGTAEVITVGDDYWVGGDEAYWAETTGDPENAAKLVGKYAPITESDATELGTFTLRSLLTADVRPAGAHRARVRHR